MRAINKYADDKDCYEKNKEHINELKKEYAQKPGVKETIKEYRKEYDKKPEVKEKRIPFSKENNNKTENIEKRKEYRQKPEVNERENNRKSEILICECGCSLSRDSISRHQKTQVHLNFIAQELFFIYFILLSIDNNIIYH